MIGSWCIPDPRLFESECCSLFVAHACCWSYEACYNWWYQVSIHEYICMFIFSNLKFQLWCILYLWKISLKNWWLQFYIHADVFFMTIKWYSRKHEWFQKDLPAYLFPPPHDHDSSVVDQDAITEVCDVSCIFILDILLKCVNICYEICEHLSEVCKFLRKPNFSEIPS